MSTVPSLWILRDSVRTLVSSRRARVVLVRSKTADLSWLTTQVVQGRLVPRVDRTFLLDEVAEANAFIETKRARGKVVITIPH